MPQGFNIGPLTIRFYAIIIITGAILGSWLAARLAKRAGRNPEVILDILPWLLIGGIIGARLWHVFTPSASNQAMGITTENYLRNPIEILKIWKGGLGIPGGVIGGALTLIIYCKAKKLNFLEWADYIAPGLLIGQAVGRWGNFVNQEVYGGPSNLPWAITIDPAYRMPGFEQVAKYHPLFLYESLLNLLAAGLLVLINRKWRKKLFTGDLFLLYLVLYPTIRFFLEFLRLDPSPVAGININQTSMLVVLIIAVLLLILRHTVWAKHLETKEQKLAEELAVEIETAKLVSSEVEVEAESIEDTVEEVEQNLENALEETEEAAPEVDLAVEEITPEEDFLPEADPKLEDDISSYPND
ncbi:MAG TPA: prolipoprotein diacylglyceryl transferase [Anaerolineaceae bacterium]|nr:prolipoprotein diacylglyceryl transferase [Anaerolineaceae bacterium]